MEKLFADLYADPDLMARFKADPKAVLVERGANPPEGVEIKILEDTADVRHLVLPYLADGESLEGDELGRRASLEIFH